LHVEFKDHADTVDYPCSGDGTRYERHDHDHVHGRVCEHDRVELRCQHDRIHDERRVRQHVFQFLLFLIGFADVLCDFEEP
jgi:hypothetical protein